MYKIFGILYTTLKTRPADGTHWSVRVLARPLGIPRMKVQRQRHAIQPHRVEKFKISNDAQFHFHFTPTSSSWLNQVERWFAPFTARMIRRGTFRSVHELEKAIDQWLATWNDRPKPFVLAATADVILEKVRGCKELNGALSPRPNSGPS